MNITQQKKILKRIVEIENDISILKQCRVDIAKTGYASASISSGGGSKSYTRLDLPKITELIVELTNEMKSLRKALKAQSDIVPIKKIYTIYC